MCDPPSAPFPRTAILAQVGLAKRMPGAEVYSDEEWKPAAPRISKRRVLAPFKTVLLVAAPEPLWHRRPTQALDPVASVGMSPLGAVLPRMRGLAITRWSCKTAQQCKANDWIAHDLFVGPMADAARRAGSRRWSHYELVDFAPVRPERKRKSRPPSDFQFFKAKN